VQINGWTHTAGTSVFNCPADGYYRISVKGTISIVSGLLVVLTPFKLHLTRNGNEISGSFWNQDYLASIGTINHGIELTVMTFISANDTITLEMTAGSSTLGLCPNTGSGISGTASSVLMVITPV
jgi:hypothetical protein